MSTDITNLLATATAPVTLSAGAYTISSNVTVSVDLTIASGAVITVPSGITLNLLRDLAAQRSRIFDGAGTVDMNQSRIAAAWPEWWGAKVNDGTFDNIPALTAAVAAHSVVHLVAGDYFIASTWKIQQPYRTVRGAGSRYSNYPARQGTRIVVNSITADTMQVGLDALPGDGDPNLFLTGVTVSHLGLWRNAAPQNPPAGQPLAGAAGLRAQYAVHCRFEDIYAIEHIIGFNIGGCVSTWFEHCSAHRSGGGSGAGTDAFYGFYLNGNVTMPKAAGGNASVYLTDCAASTGQAAQSPPPPSSAIGMGFDGAFADSFITRFETVGCAKGIVVFGISGSSANAKIGNVDLHIALPILDQCTDRCIEIANLSNYAAIEIVDPYLAPAIGALAAIHVHDGGGNLHLLGGQMLGFGDADAGGNALGVLAENQSGLRVTGSKLLGFKRPVGLNGCTAFEIAADICNPDQSGSQAAIALSGCNRGRVVSTVRGKAGAFPQALNLSGGGNAHVMVDATGLDPACITGGAANKLVINGTSITATGATGTHFVTGVMS